MKKKMKKEKEGFTLVELMIVVVILGILAVIAIPTFQKFMIRAREAEAPQNLSAIARGARTYFYDTQNRYFPGINATYYSKPAYSPSTYCSINGHNRYNANPSQWETEPWRTLRFTVSQEHYFQYKFYRYGAGKSSRFSVNAYADMDCDKTYSTRYISGYIDGASGELVRRDIVTINRGE